MDWKDTLLPGGSRTPVAVGTPGSVADYYGAPVGRMDFIMGPNGSPVISGSSEAQPGAASWVPSPGFEPVDPGQYGGNPYFGGRVAAPSALAQAAAPAGALGGYQDKSAEMLALLRALGIFTPSGVPSEQGLGVSWSGVPASGLRIPE